MGIFASFIAAILASTKDLFSKKISFHIDGTLSAFASFLFAVPYYLALLLVLWLLGLEDFAFSYRFFVLVLLRALTDAAAEWMRMQAIERGDISFVSNFISLAPLFLLVTSPLITGDPIPASGVAAVVVIVIGTLVLIQKPSDGASSGNLSAMAYGLGASLFFSLNTCFDRLAVQVASPTLSGFAMTLLAAVFLLPGVLRKKEVRESFRGCAKLLWGRGLVEVSFMVTKLFALQFLQAPYVSGIGKVSLLFSIVGGKVIFKEEQFLRRLFAGLLIVVGVLMIVWIELSK